MKILSDKLDEQKQKGASAIIVSHDMHLAVSFADIIIKIRKELRPKKHDNDEDIAYGVIDDSCIYSPDEKRNNWTNGIDTFISSSFEDFLRKK